MQYFYVVQVEGVLVVDGWVVYVVDEQVIGGLQCEVVQVDVFFVVFGCEEGDVGGVFQCFFDGVEVVVVDEFFGDYCD